MVKKIDMQQLYRYTPSLRGKQVEAQYTPQVIDGYKDNPYIEALPPIFEEEYVAMKIKKYPDYHEEQRKLGKQVRMHLVQQISDYVEPLPNHLLVEQRLSRLIRHGYKARNPFSPEYIRQYHIGFKEILDADVNEEGHNLAGVRSTAAGLAIVGVSGQGKTTAIESSLLLYPQVIQHKAYKGNFFVQKQIVWMKLNCPFDGSIKGLCINFLQEIDAHLGTNYFQKFVSKGITVDMLIPIMAQIATLHALGLLVIDEIQNLSTLKSGGAEKVLNYFTQLINTIGVPVVVIGTFKALKVLSGSFSQARRCTGQGDFIIDRLDEGEEWAYFIQRLWRYQWTSKKTDLNDSIRKTMYELSQGIIDIAVKLYMLAQWEAIDSNEKITSTLLKSVAKRYMQLVQPLLKALKLNNPEGLSLVDDLKPNWDVLDEYLQKSIEKVEMEGEVRHHIYRDEKVSQDQDRYIELVKTAIDFGATSELAEQIASSVIAHNESQRDLVALRQEVVKIVLTTNGISDIKNPLESEVKPEKKRNKKQSTYLEEEDLRQAVANRTKQNSDEIYEKLVEKGNTLDEEELSKLIF
ncbi:ATP-binding protein [Robertmurraya sp.]|uniref:ATP-binding protein n=1 Tax=Robertmurraya sp. TaxID=2837525 RepID=UPI0037041776